MIKVIPLNNAPTYVRQYNRTPNLIESTKSSTKNRRLSSQIAALACDTATDVICWTRSCDKVKSCSK